MGYAVCAEFVSISIEQINEKTTQNTEKKILNIRKNMKLLVEEEKCIKLDMEKKKITKCWTNIGCSDYEEGKKKKMKKKVECIFIQNAW